MAIQKRDWDQLLNRATQLLPGASHAGMKSTIYDVLGEFCEDSRCWREMLVINVLPGVQVNTSQLSTPDTPQFTNMTYQLTPSEGLIFELLGVYDQNMVPQAAFMPEGGSADPAIGLLTLINPVNTAQPFTVSVAKTVILPTDKDDVPIFSHVLFRRYHRYLLDGLVGQMAAEIGKTYTNAALSSYRLARFRDGLNIEKVESERQNTQGAATWSFPRGWRTRGQRGGVSTANPTSFS